MSSPSSRKASPAGSSSGRTATRRLLRELEVWRRERDEDGGVERLGPVAEENLLEWQAVINGRGIGGGYDAGRWLLTITIPDAYPLQPPAVRFATAVVHPNVALRGGAVCLDLLRDAWTPAYSVLECVRAVRQLLACPETDSPLNVDAAALLRQGDALAARRLVECWCADDDGRYDGP
ncbi:hypothetical protein CDD83_6663 [Cordyceps sp. RAO-2017]|nr:hypothetical protein CDD83_6663 [Cordyceps sp. RAO-2017]